MTLHVPQPPIRRRPGLKHQAWRSKSLSAAEVRAVRHRFGLTQQEFADLLGVSYRAVMTWEHPAADHAKPPGYLRYALDWLAEHGLPEREG